VGTAAFSYSRTSAAEPVEIDVAFKQVLDRTSQQRIDANYLYRQEPGADGKFQFSTYHPANSGGYERLAIESRWKVTGAGRSDVLVSGGSLIAPATVNECWDQFFSSQFWRASYDPSQNYGNESIDCAFSPAEYSSL